MNNPFNFMKSWGSMEYLVGGLVFVFLLSIGGSMLGGLNNNVGPPEVQAEVPEPQAQVPTFQVPEIGSTILSILPMIGALYYLKSRKG